MCQIHFVEDAYSDCEMCDVTASAPQSCKNQFAPLGYTQKCRTRTEPRGWSEVWCLDRRIAEGERKRKITLLAVAAAALLAGAVVLFTKLRPKRKT